MSVGEGADIDGVEVVYETAQPGKVEFPGGPVVQPLQPRLDHAVVEQPPQAMLVGR